MTRDAASIVPLEFDVFAHFAEPAPAPRLYGEFLEVFAAAEHLGYRTAWVRQFHLQNPHGSRSGGLPSPFLFLTALAARTTRLRLGTAAVVLPLENPVRAAEDAAVLDILSDGRLELGVANGGALPGLADAFGVHIDDDRDVQRATHLAALERLIAAVRGEPVNLRDDVVFPSRPELAERIWHATLTESSAREAGIRGDGVLVGQTQTVPAERTASAYHDGYAATGGSRPRLGLSTLIHPGPDRETALRGAERGILEKWEWGQSFLPPADTLAEKAASLNVHYGTPEQIAESIARHPAFPFATNLLVQVDYFYTGASDRRDALALFAEGVAPLLRDERASSGGIPVLETAGAHHG